MPTLPQYSAQRNIKAEKAAPFRQEADQVFQNQQKIVGTVQDVVQQWSDAHDVMQTTKSKADYQKRVLDIESRATLDPDFNNKDAYIKELTKAKTESLSGIDNQRIANAASVEFDLNNAISAQKISLGFQKKEIAANRFNLETNLSLLSQKRIPSQLLGVADTLLWDRLLVKHVD